MTNKETKPKSYMELSIAERYQMIDDLWVPIRQAILGDVPAESVNGFFSQLHKLGFEITRFMKSYFQIDPEGILNEKNIEYLNKVNTLQLMIKVS